MSRVNDTSRFEGSKRAFLGGVAGLAAAVTGGCVQRTRSLADRGSTEQVSITIKTVPADADKAATRIARRLGDNLEAVGVDASVVLESEDELRRSVLLTHDFDLYVARSPGHHDPDFLRPFLHSVYGEEPGWQNPFGFADLSVDSLLDEQRRRKGTARRETVGELLRAISRLQPFTVVCFPDEIRTVRTDRFEGWRNPGLGCPRGYLTVRPHETTNHLRVAITDRRVTRNFNPIAVEYRDQGIFTGLLYDPIARPTDVGFVEWLADSWTWGGTDDGSVVRVHLRDDLVWHDGLPLTAEDVAFTYKFLEDTSLGDSTMPVPAPRFRGRVSLVDSVAVVDERTVRLSFGSASREVARRALTVPVLPEHEWAPKAESANIAGVQLFDDVTEALVWRNSDPIGSGPLRFDRSITDEAIIFERFDDHFLHRETAANSGVGVAFETLTARVVPSDAAAVELAAVGDVNAVAASLDPSVVPRIGHEDDLDLLVGPSRSFYHVGFNTRRDPLANPRFRGTVARLLDKRAIVDDVFDGYATPVGSPILESNWTPTDLRWEDGDPVVPFLGADGGLDESTGMDAFREIGYRYDDDGRLLGR